MKIFMIFIMVCMLCGCTDRSSFESCHWQCIKDSCVLDNNRLNLVIESSFLEDYCFMNKTASQERSIYCTNLCSNKK